MGKKKGKPARGKLADKRVALVGDCTHRPTYMGWIVRAGGTLVDPETTVPDYLVAGRGRGGKPPAIVAEIQRRRPAVQVLDPGGFQRLLAPTGEELLAALRAGPLEPDQWEEIERLITCFPPILDLSGADFRGTCPRGARFGYAALDGCDFRSTDLSHARPGSMLRGLERVRFDGATLYAAQIYGADDCSFRNADLREASLDGQFERADFGSANLTGARVRGAAFVGCVFRGADLTRLDALGATFEGAVFTGATLRRAYLRAASLAGADLRDADLRDATLAGADLTGADVAGADFTGAVLAGAKTGGVDARKAKNFRPARTRAPGPDIRAFAAVASKTFESEAEIELGPGEYVRLTISCNHGRRYVPHVEVGSRYRCGDGESFSRLISQSVKEALIDLADRWPNATLLPASVRAGGSRTARGQKLRDLALAAWAEAFGLQLTGAEISGAATRSPGGFKPAPTVTPVTTGPAARRLPAVEPGSLDFTAFLGRLHARVEATRVRKALAMLKAERFQLFFEVAEDALVGVVKSQSNAELVYSCRLTAEGNFGCCTQNLRPCGGLAGKPCKHLLVLVVGLAKAGKLDPATADGWLAAGAERKPEVDKEAMSATFLRYKGAEAGEVDWRPTETIPEDFYAV
jgi:uncharacterized protein YjbI with pentapeptide repeats